MNSAIEQTSLRIRAGIDDLETLVHRIKEGWVRAEHNGDTYYLPPIQKLVENTPIFFNRVKAELVAFADFLDDAS